MGEGQTPWHAAAMAGFKGFSEPNLDKLLARDGVLQGVADEDRPKGVLPKVELLVRYHLPGIASAELAAIMKGRAGLMKNRKQSILMASDNLEHSGGCLDPSDLGEAKEFKGHGYAATVSMKAQTLKYLVERQLVDPKSIAQELADCGAKAAPDAPSTRGPKTKDVWSWGEKYLKTCIPKVEGCSIQEVKNQYSKVWVARYPGVTPGSRSRSYTNESGSQSAAKHVFQWVWQVHAAKTGAKIPNDLQSDILAPPGA